MSAASLVLFAACTAPAGGGPTNPQTTPGATTPAATSGASMAAGVVLSVRQDATLGAFVSGANGMSLYVFKQDSDGKSACAGECATNWPPLTVASASDVTAGTGVTGELGTIKRDDGTTQVTLDGKPLYYFKNDKAAGDMNGQGVNDVWYLVSPAGEPVGDDDDAMSPRPAASGCGRYCY